MAKRKLIVCSTYGKHGSNDKLSCAIDYPKCTAGCGRPVKRMGLNCSKCPYRCACGCGRTVKRYGFYFKKCRPLCDGPVFFDLAPCYRIVRREGDWCGACRSVFPCDDCGNLSMKVDGTCKFCIYECAKACGNYVERVSMLCSRCQIKCPVLGCSKMVKMNGDTVCWNCQCKTRGCNRQYRYLSKRCENCTSAFLMLWHFYRKERIMPYEIVVIILRLAKMAVPKRIKRQL